MTATSLCRKHPFKILKISGPDASNYLHKMTSQDFLKFPVGTCRYAALLDRKGMVLSLFLAYHETEQDYLLILQETLLAKTNDIFTKMKFIQKVIISEPSDLKLFLFLGEPNPLPSTGLLFKDPDMPFSQWFFIGVEEPESFSTYPSIDYQQIRLLQIKAGFPEYGTDIGEENILLEARFPVAHIRGKGCYPGQEVIERITSYGKGRTPKTLCSFSKIGTEEISSGILIHDSEGKEAGIVTSSLVDHNEGKTYIMASIQHPYIGADITLNIKQSPLTPIVLPNA